MYAEFLLDSQGRGGGGETFKTYTTFKSWLLSRSRGGGLPASSPNPHPPTPSYLSLYIPISLFSSILLFPHPFLPPPINRSLLIPLLAPPHVSFYQSFSLTASPPYLPHLYSPPSHLSARFRQLRRQKIQHRRDSPLGEFLMDEIIEILVSLSLASIG